MRFVRCLYSLCHALCSCLQIGDVLFEVNRNNVYCTNPEEIGGYLLGHEGTQVYLPPFNPTSASMTFKYMRRVLSGGIRI